MRDLPIEVIRSARRKRTAQAYVTEGKLRVMVPAGLDPDQEERVVERMVAQMERKMSSEGIDVDKRARELARKYDLPEPVSIEWSSRQMRRWGSCTPEQGRIRISDRLAAMPGWVLDSVLVHELAHLEVPGHGPRFKDLVGRYELGERATGYLLAKGEESGLESFE